MKIIKASGKKFIVELSAREYALMVLKGDAGSGSDEPSSHPLKGRPRDPDAVARSIATRKAKAQVKASKLAGKIQDPENVLAMWKGRWAGTGKKPPADLVAQVKAQRQAAALVGGKTKAKAAPVPRRMLADPDVRKELKRTRDREYQRLRKLGLPRDKIAAVLAAMASGTKNGKPGPNAGRKLSAKHRAAISAGRLLHEQAKKKAGKQSGAKAKAKGAKGASDSAAAASKEPPPALTPGGGLGFDAPRVFELRRDTERAAKLALVDG